MIKLLKLKLEEKMFLLILFLSLNLFSQGLLFDDFIKLNRLSNLKISEDGNYLAFEVSKADLEKNKFIKQIWVYIIKENKFLQMTNHERSSSNPKFSKDRKILYFLSSRDGVQNLWGISLDGGEAFKVTDFKVDVEDFYPLKNGDFILNLSIFKECKEDLKCTKEKLKEIEENPVKAKIIENLYYRVFDEWQDGRVAHLFYFNLKENKLSDLTESENHIPPKSLGNAYHFSVSPDENLIAYTTNRDKYPERSTNHDLILLNLKDKNTQNITEKNRGCDFGPIFSPDGKYILFSRMKREGFEADKVDLILYNLTSKEEKNLTENIDISVSEYSFFEDKIYFTAQVHKDINLYQIELKNFKIDLILKGQSVSNLNPSKEIIYFLNQKTTFPPEIFSFNLKDKKTKKLSSFNDEILSKLKLNEVEEISYKSYDGTEVYGLILKPPSFDEGKKYPMVVLLHGGPQWAFTDTFHYRWNAQIFASDGYFIFMPNFRGSTGYGEKYKEAITRNWGSYPYEDVLSGVEYLTEKFKFIDKEKMAAAGASYGGYLANWIATHNHPFKCIISHAGLWDLKSKYGTTDELWFPEWEFGGDPYSSPELYEKWSPSSYAKNLRVPMLIIHGAKDFRVSENQAFQIFTALKRLGVEAKLLYFPDETHFVSKPKNSFLWWKEVLGFLRENLTR